MAHVPDASCPTRPLQLPLPIPAHDGRGSVSLAHVRPCAVRSALRIRDIAGGMGDREPMSALRTACVCAGVGIAAYAAPNTGVAAEMAITAQAVAAHGEFLTQVPVPTTQGVLCLVDSGVDINADTEPILLGRESVFDGTVDDVTSYHHGTYVAMVAGAAANGWGMVGAWPHLRVLSVRALPEG